MNYYALLCLGTQAEAETAKAYVPQSYDGSIASGQSEHLAGLLNSTCLLTKKNLSIPLHVFNRRFGGGVQPRNRLVSFRSVRACVLARGLAAWWSSIPEVLANLFPFTFGTTRLSFFPCV